MKILFLTNNTVSAPLANWLSERAEVIIWQENISLSLLNEIGPDLVVSYSYRHIIKTDVLAALPNKFINLHISFLPYNRGADPNAWSFLLDTPKGITIHLIDEGIDTGPILAQEEVEFDENNETLGHSYTILQDRIQALFKKHWPQMCDGAISALPQKGEGSHHYAREFSAIKDELMGEEGWNVNIRVFKERYAKYLALM